MSSSLHFPAREVMTAFLSNHSLIKTPCFEEKGITQAISEMAAQRFADMEVLPFTLEMQIQLLVCDLQTGTDGYTGKPIPNYVKVELPRISWTLMSIAIKDALEECANKNKV